MKTKEGTKIIRTFTLLVVWTMFAALTTSGLIVAGERTRYIEQGRTFLNDAEW